MKPQRNPRYLAWIRTQPCCVCGSRKAVEASHTGPHGIGQKSADTSAIPLCAKHHRTGADSYHRLGPRKFSEKHNLDIPAIVRRLSAKPVIRIEADFFVTYFENSMYVLGKTEGGIRPAVQEAVRLFREVGGDPGAAVGPTHAQAVSVSGPNDEKQFKMVKIVNTKAAHS